VHTQDQSDLCKALAVHNREDGEEIFDPAQAAKVLGRLQVVRHFFTVGGRANRATTSFALVGRSHDFTL